MKFCDFVTYQASENPIDFRENLFKFKVTVKKISLKIGEKKVFRL